MSAGRQLADTRPLWFVPVGLRGVALRLVGALQIGVGRGDVLT
ncbi:hypothetical protein [Streptomyces sp. NPDC090798]